MYSLTKGLYITRYWYILEWNSWSFGFNHCFLQWCAWKNVNYVAELVGCAVEVCPFSQSDRLVSKSRLRQGPGFSSEQSLGDIRILASIFKQFLIVIIAEKKLKIWHEQIHYRDICWSKQRTLKLCELEIVSFIFPRLLILKPLCRLPQWIWVCIGEVLQIVGKETWFLREQKGTRQQNPCWKERYKSAQRGLREKETQKGLYKAGVKQN